MLSGKAADVMRHKWFEGVDWEALAAKRVTPPRKPRVRRARVFLGGGAFDDSGQVAWAVRGAAEKRHCSAAAFTSPNKQTHKQANT